VNASAGLSLRAHAKINLRLRVLGQRPDGYHELRTVFQSLALHDTLRFEAADEPMALACRARGVPLDARNLVWRAAELVWRAAGRSGEPRGRARIAKRIPVQGGLGGGSADGAAALVAWDRLWNAGLGVARLSELGAALGADVPFFLHGGTAVGVGRGDQLQPLDDSPGNRVVLVFPPFGVSTAEAFGWWDADHASGATPAAAATTRADDDGSRPGEAAVEIANDLEAPVARRHPVIRLIRDRLRELGAHGAAMTGSGSTVFGLFSSDPLAHAAVASLRVAGWPAIATRTATRREAGLFARFAPD
jgi:4-diphosphocytidyl-2-C-methyl-D-erythritol kinase